MKFFFFLLKFIPPLLLLSTDPGESQGHVSRWTGKQQLQDSQDGMGQQGGETEANWSSLGAGQGGAPKAVDPV